MKIFSFIMIVFCIVFFVFDLITAIAFNMPQNYIWAAIMLACLFINYNTYTYWRDR